MAFSNGNNDILQNLGKLRKETSYPLFYNTPSILFKHG